MDRTRDSLKKVNRFALREYKESHPKSIRVLQVKAKRVLTRGVLPNYHNPSYWSLEDYVLNIEAIPIITIIRV